MSTRAVDSRARLAPHEGAAAHDGVATAELRVALDTVTGALVEAVAERAAEIVLARLGDAGGSPFLSVPEAAEWLRCRRQRIDDLLSQRRLTRFKDGARTLVSRAELEEYMGLNGVAPALPLASDRGS